MFFERRYWEISAGCSPEPFSRKILCGRFKLPQREENKFLWNCVFRKKSQCKMRGDAALIVFCAAKPVISGHPVWKSKKCLKKVN